MSKLEVDEQDDVDELIDGVDVDDEEDSELLDFLKPVELNSPSSGNTYSGRNVGDYLCRVAANNSRNSKSKGSLFNFRKDKSKLPLDKRSTVDMVRLEQCVKEIKRLRLQRLNEKLNETNGKVSSKPAQAFAANSTSMLVSKVPAIRKSFLDKIKLFHNGG